MRNDFDSFSDLPVEMQSEAIREGEERVKAQLVIANNADQRALSWARLHIGSATAAFGACVAFLGKSEADYYLASVSLVFSVLIARAGWHALDAAKHDRAFNLPGNTPLHWLPDEDDMDEAPEEAVARSRREQARCLADQIEDNANIAEQRGLKMDRCYEIMQVAIALSGSALFIIVLARTALAMNGVDTSLVE